MSRRGVEIARDNGGRLPAFSSQAEAETSLRSLRDQRLAQMQGWATSAGSFLTNGTPESLKALEAWYFKVVASSPITLGASKDELDATVGAYLGQVFVESAGFEWIVEQDTFVPGRYGIGVRKGLVTLMLTQGVSPDPLVRNKQKQSLFRRYRKYAA